MALVDLAYTPKERKEEVAEMKAYEPPEYPWGLQIRLENDELKKLGIKDLPAVGSQFSFDVVARVTGVNQNQYADGREERCVCLQICEMGTDDDDEAKEAPAKKAEPAREAPKAGVLGGKY